jgi:hypothetical protein
LAELKQLEKQRLELLELAAFTFRFGLIPCLLESLVLHESGPRDECAGDGGQQGIQTAERVSGLPKFGEVVLAVEHPGGIIRC